MDRFGFSLCIQVDRATQNCDSQVKSDAFRAHDWAGSSLYYPYFYVVYFASSNTCRYDQ
jgi:hypothetical protein